MAGKIMKAMIAMGVSLGIVGLLFTIYCNVQLKTAKCQTYSVDHTEKIKEVDYVIEQFRRIVKEYI